jgi:hypothetical protein
MRPPNPKSVEARIESFSDQRDIGNGIFVYLEPGWAMISTSVANAHWRFATRSVPSPAGSWVARASDAP